MASIVIVGAGFAGMSAAARLAKLGHEVTVYDAASRTGGRMNGVTVDGEVWYGSSPAVTLPGVFRDLFRKSGRPLKAVLDLNPAPERHHIFPGKRRTIAFDLPTGTRSAQHDAIIATFGKDPWSPWVDSLVEDWDLTRRFIFDKITTVEDVEAIVHRLSARTTAYAAVRQGIPHRQLRALALDRWSLIGVNPKQVPALWNMWNYVERNFGRWRFDGDLPGLTAALTKRLEERKVLLSLNTPVVGVKMKFGRVIGIQTESASVEADHVIWASGHKLPGLAIPSFESPDAVYLGFTLDGYSLPAGLIVHGKTPMQLWDSGPNRWVASALRGTDIVKVLHQIGVPHDAIISMIQIEPPEHRVQFAHTAGSGLNLELQSRRAKKQLSALVPRPAIEAAPGLYVVGGSAIPGSSLELTGMGTAAVANAIGPTGSPRAVATARGGH